MDASGDAWKRDPRVEAAETTDAAWLRGFRGETYVEVPPDSELAAIRSEGRRAKIRCGGRAVPSVEELGSFVRRCRELSLPFKATAGLHHAVRTNGEHGLLNLLAAAVFGDEEEALSERDPAAFALGAAGFSWRGRSAAAAEVARVRRDLFVGFGSCSAQEPADDLRALGFLP